MDFGSPKFWRTLQYKAAFGLLASFVLLVYANSPKQEWLLPAALCIGAVSFVVSVIASCVGYQIEQELLDQAYEEQTCSIEAEAVTLKPRCPHCHSRNDAEARFCNQCGEGI
ncbi:MAG: hypothetical protein JWN98_308 [Abditibacteriota bacterium]|nr:hypothetical protein [Abditibacteriota bacterium]